MKTYEIRNIVQIWLKDNGFDGLCDEDYECGCDIADLMPCDEPRPGCTAGYKKKDETGEYDYVIVPGGKHEERITVNTDTKKMCPGGGSCMFINGYCIKCNTHKENNQ